MVKTLRVLLYVGRNNLGIDLRKPLLTDELKILRETVFWAEVSLPHYRT